MTCHHCRSVIDYGMYIRCLRCGGSLCGAQAQCLRNHTEFYHPEHMGQMTPFDVCSTSAKWGYVAVIALTVAAIFVMLIYPNELP